ncbi:MAG: nuclear transport factor 2 family protein [Pseudomonadota bacterium]
MSEMESAKAFFEACETGQGWAACQAWCHPDASFSCQAGALAEVTTLDGYCGWMAAIFGPIPDAHYELTAFAYDAERATAVASAIFKGTNTGPLGSKPGTGKSVATDYVYVMQFEGGKIRHMTKVWNDVPALKSLGWA